MGPVKNRSDQGNIKHTTDGLPGWFAPGMAVVGGLWLLGVSSHSQQGLEAASTQWILGTGWGRWLLVNREGSVSAGEVSWEGYSVALVADWLIMVPLLLLAASLALARSARLQGLLGQAWQRMGGLHAVSSRLSIALSFAIGTLLAAVLLLPGEHRTEILLPASNDVTAVRERVESKLLDHSAVRAYEIRVEEEGRVLVEVVTRSWLYFVGPRAADLVPDLGTRGGWQMSLEMRGSNAAMPLGILAGLMALFVPLVRRSS
jgi:hypothetical protein